MAWRAIAARVARSPFEFAFMGQPRRLSYFFSSVHFLATASRVSPVRF